MYRETFFFPKNHFKHSRLKRPLTALPDFSLHSSSHSSLPIHTFVKLFLTSTILFTFFNVTFDLFIFDVHFLTFLSHAVFIDTDVLVIFYYPI